MTLYVNEKESGDEIHAWDRDDDARALTVADPHEVGTSALCGGIASEILAYPLTLYRPKWYLDNYPGALAGGDTSIARFVSEVITCPECQREARGYLGIDREARAEARTSDDDERDDERTSDLADAFLSDAGGADERRSFSALEPTPQTKASLDPRLLGLSSWSEFDPSDQSHREVLARVLDSRERRANEREGRATSHPNARCSTSRVVTGTSAPVEVSFSGATGSAGSEGRSYGRDPEGKRPQNHQTDEEDGE